MNGMPSSAVISLSFPATSICSCSLSTTHGPAMRKNGLSRPTSKPQSFIFSKNSFIRDAYRYKGDLNVSVCIPDSVGVGSADDLQRRLRHAQLVLLERG